MHLEFQEKIRMVGKQYTKDMDKNGVGGEWDWKNQDWKVENSIPQDKIIEWDKPNDVDQMQE